MGQMWYGAKYLPPQTGASDPVHFSRYDPPEESPQLGGQSLPPLVPRLRGIGTRRGERHGKALSSQFTHTKTTGHERRGFQYMRSKKRALLEV